MKSPFNWVGNKYKFIPVINELVKGKSYNMVVDLFLGSGNVSLNIACQRRMTIANDNQRLIPFVLERISLEKPFCDEEINSVLNKNNRFSSNDDYYLFREYWNKKYLSNSFDREFVLETALLLKMCSNSMVRFNRDGVFNQGFRGLGKDSEFFKKTMLDSVLEQINDLIVFFQNNKFKFTNKDFKEYKDESTNNRLLILDPPYDLGDAGMYNKDFTKNDSDFLLSLLRTTKNDFVYFNYLEHGTLVHLSLKSLIEEMNFKVVEIGDNNVSAGQGKLKDKKWVKEVMVTNV